MPFTPIGSLGDIIALSVIIKDLIKALDESRGSSAEYQESIKKLWALNRVLQEVETLCSPRESTVELTALRETMSCIANQSRQSIEVFLKNVRKFGPSLREGGSGNSVRDALRKAQWRVSHSDELAKFRAEIDVHCSIFTVLLSTANTHRMKRNDERLHARLESSEEKVAISTKEQSLLLNEIKDQLHENNEQVRAGNAITSKIIESLRVDWIRSLSLNITKFMHGIFATTFAIHRVVLDIRGRLPSHLERCLYQEPFVLEDSHGRIKPVHLDCINSWEAFDAWLEVQFRGLQGHTMVQNKDYVLHESAANRDIEQRRPWETSFLPGQRIVMCMLFADYTGSTCCPKCFLESPVAKDSEIKCAQCGIWYRRKTESDTSEAPEAKRRTAIEHESGRADSSDILANKKHKLDHEGEESVASFKRVRMLSKTPISWGCGRGEIDGFYNVVAHGNELLDRFQNIQEPLNRFLQQLPIHQREFMSTADVYGQIALRCCSIPEL